MKVALIFLSFLLTVFNRKYLVETDDSEKMPSKPKNGKDFSRKPINIIVEDPQRPFIDYDHIDQVKQKFKTLDKFKKRYFLNRINMDEKKFLSLDALPSHITIRKETKDERAMRLIRKKLERCVFWCGNNCFYQNSEVETESGTKRLSGLVLGDHVATHSDSNGIFYTEFLGWLDRGSSIANFLEITTTSGRKVTMTKSHIIFVEQNKDQFPKYAGDVTLEDKLYTMVDDRLQAANIASIKNVVLEGYRTPLTEEGTLLVDGILCSCYASYEHYWSQIAFSPVKLWPYLLEDSQSQHEDGVRTVVKAFKQLGNALNLRRKTRPNAVNRTICMEEKFNNVNLNDVSVGVADKFEL